MPYSIAFTCRRKAGLSPAEFQSYFETTHVPLIQSHLGPLFPKRHLRYYVAREESGNHEAKMLLGPQVDYDAVCVLEWEDEATSQKYFEKFRQPETFEAIMADDAKFVDRASTVVYVLGASQSTE